jgi:DNA-binding PadR family transcriptional regulator
MFFLESSLLVLLLREPGYGYSLTNGLGEFGFQPELLDASVIYRALRDLEARGLVSDSWDDKSLGPPRRVYTITSEGRATLAGWMESLRQNRKEIEVLEAAYEAAKNLS